MDAPVPEMLDGLPRSVALPSDGDIPVCACAESAAVLGLSAA